MANLSVCESPHSNATYRSITIINNFGIFVAAHSGPVSALAKLVDGALKSPYEFDAISANYTDNGLFGFVLTANAQEVGKVSLIC